MTDIVQYSGVTAQRGDGHIIFQQQDNNVAAACLSLGIYDMGGCQKLLEMEFRLSAAPGLEGDLNAALEGSICRIRETGSDILKVALMGRDADMRGGLGAVFRLSDRAGHETPLVSTSMQAAVLREMMDLGASPA